MSNGHDDEGGRPALTQPSAPTGPRRGLLATGGVVRGVFLKLPAAALVDIAADSGFDFAVVDREHSQLSEREALELIERARLVGMPALLRLPAVDSGQINRALEAGAVGIQLSTVRTVEQIAAVRRATRCPSGGERSISLAHASGGYGRRDLGEYGAEQDADPPIVVAQIETGDTDDPLEEIFAAGVDVAFIGSLDLAYAMRADLHARAARIDAIAAAAERTQTRLGGAGIDDPRVVFAANHTDVALFRAGCASAMPARTGAASTPDEDPTAPRTCASADEKPHLEALLVEFAYRLDVHEGRGVAELFCPDGSYTVDGGTVHGRDEIRAGYDRRRSRGARSARHLVSNVRVTMLSRDRAQIDSCLVLYAADGEPVHASGSPLVVGDFCDVATREPGASWLFESRELRTVFQGAGPVVSPAGVC